MIPVWASAQIKKLKLQPSLPATFEWLHVFFQESKNALLHTMWLQISEFAREDPAVLSVNQTEQFLRVNRGKYAYLAEETALKVETSESCELDIIHEPLAAVSYSIGLQKNSAFNGLFSEK